VSQYAGGLRWSYTARAWFGAFEIAPNGRIFLRHELTWLNVPPEIAAQDFQKFQEHHGIKLAYVVGNPEIFPRPKEHGETVSETLRRGGMPMTRGSDDRLAALSRCRSWFAKKTDAGPAFVVHPSCAYFIRTVPTLISKDTEPDNVNETVEEYPAIATALFLMSRPMPAVAPPKPPPKPGTWGHALADGYAKAANLRARAVR
jgi:hypothetical protein